MATVDKIKQLTRQLYPKGRAFKIPYSGTFDKLNNALAASEARAYDDATAILNSILPDNSNFTATDATDWERRLGILQQNTTVTLADRKLAIKRKMRHPGDILARQHYLYLQGQLQAAGFDVYVYENRISDGYGGYETSDPVTQTGNNLCAVQLNDAQLGDFQLGGGWCDRIINHIDTELDESFDIGANLRSTFFIGGSTLGTYAEVPLARKSEFRQLVLRIKPVQTVAFLFINYTY